MKCFEYVEDHFKAVLLNVQSFLKTCGFETRFQFQLDVFLQKKLEADDSLSVIAPSSITAARSSSIKKQQFIPSVLLKPASTLAKILCAVSIAFNFGLVESNLSISQQYNLRSHINILASFMNDLKQRYRTELGMRTSEEMKKSNSPAISQLVIISGKHDKCKLIKEIAILPTTANENGEVLIEALSKLRTEEIEVANLEKIEQALEFVVQFLKDRELDAEFSISIEFQPYSAYNEKRGKYELSKGTLKTADEMVDIYLGLVRSYPQIKRIVNPFRTEESKVWMKLNEKLKSLEGNPQVEIGSTVYSYKANSGYRLSSAPPISTIVSFLSTPSEKIENDDRLQPFLASSIISFSGTIEPETECIVLKDIVEAIIWIKDKQKKKIQFNLLHNYTTPQETNLTLAMAVAFGADVINFGRLDDLSAQCKLSEWIATVYSSES
nr:enolase protein ENO4 [Hymenolepis microstoma]